MIYYGILGPFNCLHTNLILHFMDNMFSITYKHTWEWYKLFNITTYSLVTVWTFLTAVGVFEQSNITKKKMDTLYTWDIILTARKYCILLRGWFDKFINLTFCSLSTFIAHAVPTLGNNVLLQSSWQQILIWFGHSPFLRH